MAGKGSKARPFSVSKEVFDSNWENIFKKKDTADGKEQEVKPNADQDRETTSRSIEPKTTN